MRNSTRCAALALLLVLAPACGDDDDDASSDDGGTDTTEEASDTTAADEGGGEEASGEQCTESPGVAQILILDFAFDPSERTVSSGEEITVQNLDATTHTFTSDELGFDCEIGAAGFDATVVIDADPGEYEFHCEIHPSMTGTITVE